MDGHAPYDEAFWDSYAEANEARYNAEFAGFVRDLAASLRCSSVLEVGCGTGIDLRLFPDGVAVHGIDMNRRALAAARGSLPAARLGIGTISRLPFPDCSVDLVFTHQLLNYLDDRTLDAGVAEMHRVSARYVVNCEVFGDPEAGIGGGRRARNMLGRWAGYPVRVVSNVDMHADIEPESARFTLVRKVR